MNQPQPAKTNPLGPQLRSALKPSPTHTPKPKRPRCPEHGRNVACHAWSCGAGVLCGHGHATTRAQRDRESEAHMEFHANRAGLYTLPHRGEERNRMVHDRVLPAIRHYHQEVGCVACDVRQSCIEDARGVPA